MNSDSSQLWSFELIDVRFHYSSSWFVDMSHSKCRFCQADMHLRDGHRELPILFGYAASNWPLPVLIHPSYRTLGGMTEDELGVISPMIGVPDNFTKLPKLTSLTLQLGEDFWGSVLPWVPNPGETLQSGLGVIEACSQLRLDSWEKCTSDPLVLDIIEKGYMIQFRRRPPSFSGVHMTIVKDPVQAQILTNEITNLLLKKAIVQISTSEQLTGFYSK